MRRTLILVAGWVLAAAAAAAVGVLSLSLLGSGITGGQVHVLSAHDAAAAWANATTDTRPSPSTSPAAAPTTTSAPTQLPATSTAPSQPAHTGTPKSATRALTSRGGTVVARCTGDEAYLVSWTPRQGFEIEDRLRGPGTTAYVKFDSDTLEVHVTVGCRDGVPVSLSATQPDD